MNRTTIAVLASLSAAACAAPASAASLRFSSSGSDWTLRIHIGGGWGGGLNCDDTWFTDTRTSTRLTRSEPLRYENSTTAPKNVKFTARRDGDSSRIIITATGNNGTASWQTSLAPQGTKRGVPVLRLDNRRPIGNVSTATTPFTHQATVYDDDANSVRVQVGTRTYRVRVRN